MSEKLSLEEILVAVKLVKSWDESFNTGESGEYSGNFIIKKSGSKGRIKLCKERDADYSVEVVLKGESIGEYHGAEAVPLYESIERDFKEKEEKKNYELLAETERMQRLGLTKSRRLLYGKEGDAREFTLQEALELVETMDIKPGTYHFGETNYQGKSHKKTRCLEVLLNTGASPKGDASDELNYHAGIVLTVKKFSDTIFLERPEKEVIGIAGFNIEESKQIFELAHRLYEAKGEEEKALKLRDNIDAIRNEFGWNSSSGPLSFDEVLGIAEKVGHWDRKGYPTEELVGKYQIGKRDLEISVKRHGTAPNFGYYGSVYSDYCSVYSFQEQEVQQIFEFAEIRQREIEERRREREKLEAEAKPTVVDEFREAFIAKPKLPLGRRLGR